MKKSLVAVILLVVLSAPLASSIDIPIPQCWPCDNEDDKNRPPDQNPPVNGRY